VSIHFKLLNFLALVFSKYFISIPNFETRKFFSICCSRNYWKPRICQSTYISISRSLDCSDCLFVFLFLYFSLARFVFLYFLFFLSRLVFVVSLSAILFYSYLLSSCFSFFSFVCSFSILSRFVFMLLLSFFHSFICLKFTRVSGGKT
jgi:hypothetical protein